MLTRRVNLWDTKLVDTLIKKTEWSGKRRNNVSYAYKDWCNWKGFDYEFKYYREDDPPLPYIPTEKEIDQLIAGVPSKYACFLQLLKESAFRPIEAASLTPNDVNFDRRIITLNKPAKRSKPRQFRMSEKLTSMIATRMNSIPANQRIWTSRTQDMSRTFIKQRRALAEKLGNPNLIKITFKTFSHWKATMEYHRTKDILYVKELLGHKNIQNTLVYTHLVSFEEEDAFIVKVASSIEEFSGLLESGFEYVTDYEGGLKILKKRK